jgi:beta-glucosidase
MAFDVIWFEPMTNARVDVEAAKRGQEFQLGWFADPFFFGNYPATMRRRVGERLPRFAQQESALVKGALDFVGINHYTRHNDTNIIDGSSTTRWPTPGPSACVSDESAL